ncbi:AbrB/MazE/SpoVT family DNA-binding domain-containing protein [bacterium]|nr:AbrB/MazE/SpoVT family DNA-binding domain-containing protein [bacterium]
MQKYLVKHGNSMALVIEKPILELLGADANTLFDITTDGQTLMITPIQDKKRRAAFCAARNKVIRNRPKISRN